MARRRAPGVGLRVSEPLRQAPLSVAGYLGYQAHRDEDVSHAAWSREWSRVKEEEERAP